MWEGWTVNSFGDSRSEGVVRSGDFPHQSLSKQLGEVNSSMCSAEQHVVLLLFKRAGWALPAPGALLGTELRSQSEPRQC